MRRRIAGVLLAVFAALTVQAGFFHSCQHDGHDPVVAVTDDHDSRHVDGEETPCAACLLTRALAACEPTHAPEPVRLEGSEGIEIVAGRLSAALSVVFIAVRAPPGC